MTELNVRLIWDLEQAEPKGIFYYNPSFQDEITRSAYKMEIDAMIRDSLVRRRTCSGPFTSKSAFALPDCVPLTMAVQDRCSVLGVNPVTMRGFTPVIRGDRAKGFFDKICADLLLVDLVARLCRNLPSEGDYDNHRTWEAFCERADRILSEYKALGAFGEAELSREVDKLPSLIVKSAFFNRAIPTQIPLSAAMLQEIQENYGAIFGATDGVEAESAAIPEPEIVVPAVKSANKPQRVVVCAACRKEGVIFAGARHYDLVMQVQMDATGTDGPCDEGFIDQWGVFMNRKEALAVATAAGQINARREKTWPEDELFSEDLY